MDYVNTKITSSDANTFFGKGTDGFPLSSTVLEATLRYIAVTRHQGDIEKVRLINVATLSFTAGDRGNTYTRYGDYDIVIAKAQSGSSRVPLLAIDEEGWASLDGPPFPVAPFLSKASETRIYINTQTKRVVVFVRNTTVKWITCFCSSLFRILPWYFENGVTDTDKALFTALNKDDGEKFAEVINEVCAAYDFKKMVQKRTLLGWGNGYRESQIQRLQSDNQDYLGCIEDCERKIANYLNSIANNTFTINALQAQAVEDNDIFYNFFSSREQLSIYRITNCSSGGKSLFFSITDTIEYFDQEAFMRMYNTPGSCFGDHDNPVTKVFYGIFAQEKGAIRVESVFRLDNLSSLSPQRDTTSGNFTYTQLPHPHLYHHACLGGNATPISKYMGSGNWDMAIDQAIAATKNFNFGDSVVVREFIDDIRRNFDGGCKCIIADNGTEMTPREFLQYLESSNNNNEDTANG